MTLHYDTGGHRPACHSWRPRPHWDVTTDSAAVTCKRCERIAGKVAAEEPPAEESREDWLEWRRGGLGGSDIAAILGVSPWATPFDVWISKVEGVGIGDNRAMHMGRFLERAVGQAAAEHYGRDLIEAGPREMTAHPVCRGTADFLFRDAGLEVKTTRERSWDGIPIQYEVQCRWYMEVYDVDVWHLAALHAGTEFSFHTIHRHRLAGERMVERGLAWWARHIEGGERPELQGGQVGSYLTQQHRASTGIYVLAEHDEAAMIAELQLAREVEKKAKARAEMLADALKARIGDASGLETPTHRLRWSRFDRKATDFKALKADPARARALDALCEPYTTTTPSGRLTIEDRT